MSALVSFLFLKAVVCLVNNIDQSSYSKSTSVNGAIVFVHPLLRKSFNGYIRIYHTLISIAVIVGINQVLLNQLYINNIPIVCFWGINYWWSWYIMQGRERIPEEQQDTYAASTQHTRHYV